MPAAEGRAVVQQEPPIRQIQRGQRKRQALCHRLTSRNIERNVKPLCLPSRWRLTSTKTDGPQKIGIGITVEAESLYHRRNARIQIGEATIDQTR